MEQIPNQLLELNSIEVPEAFDRVIPFKYEELYIKYEIPAQEFAPFCGGYFGIREIFNYFSFEDFLFVILAITQEKSVIFVSNHMDVLTSTIMAFINLINPFKWPFPSIYSLPESCLQILGSPIPILIGIKQTYKYVLKHILPEINLSSNGGQNIIVFIDYNYILCDKDVASSITIPNMNNFFKKLKSEFHTFFNLKSSKYLKITGTVEKGRNFQLKRTDSVDMKQLKQLTRRNTTTIGSSLSDTMMPRGHDHFTNFMQKFQEYFTQNFVDRMPED